MPPRPHSGLWEDTTSSLSSGASCQPGGSAGGQGAQSVEGSDSSLHCWGWVLWGRPLGTATVRATVTPLPREGLQLYMWVPHRIQAGSLRPDTGAWAAWRWGGVCCMRRMTGSQPAKEGGRRRGGRHGAGGWGPWARRAGGSDEVRV